MKEPFTLDKDGMLKFYDRKVGLSGSVTYTPGDALAAFHKGVDVIIALAPAPGGDALFVARDMVFGVERKTTADFFSSRASGHLADQLTTMLQYYDSVILMIEHGITLRDCQVQGVPFDTLQTALLDWQDCGVRIVTIAGGPKATAAFIEKLRIKYITRDAQEPFRKPTANKYTDEMKALNFKGIGPKTREKLLRIYGTPWAAISAPYLDIVARCGPAVADRIFDGLKRPREA